MSDQEYLKRMLDEVLAASDHDDSLSLVLYSMASDMDLSTAEAGTIRLRLAGGSVLDAARALTEALFPDGWLDLAATKGRASAKLCFEGNRAYWSDNHPTLATAILVALLRCLSARAPAA